MTREEAWMQLTSAGCVSGDLPEPVVSNPWYVKVMLAFSGWLASLFLFAFFGAAFSSLLDEPSFCLVLGLGLNAGAYAVFRKQPSDFIEHLGLALSLAGQGLVAFAVADSLAIDEASTWLVAALYEAALLVLMPNSIHRVFSSVLSLLALGVAMVMVHLTWLFDAALLGMTAVCGLNVFTWPSQIERLQAALYGLVITLILFYGIAHFDPFLLQYWANRNVSPDELQALMQRRWLIWGAEVLTLGYVAWMLGRRAGLSVSSGAARVMMVGVVLAAAVAWQIDGLIVGMLVLILGYSQSHRLIMALGIVVLLTFTSSYYYSLSSTLLAKSGYLLAMGGGLLGVRWIMNRFLDKEEAPHA
ncbi:MAG: DUF4401 domain-containing protein [Hahellaceae bacterium]|jgi:hypothetical protein|nr:DUF4401 domain-containing protein [Hahellaceae bacterium]